MGDCFSDLHWLQMDQDEPKFNVSHDKKTNLMTFQYTVWVHNGILILYWHIRVIPYGPNQPGFLKTAHVAVSQNHLPYLGADRRATTRRWRSVLFREKRRIKPAVPNVVVFCMLKRCHPVGLLKTVLCNDPVGRFCWSFFSFRQFVLVKKMFFLPIICFFRWGDVWKWTCFLLASVFFGRGRAEWKWIEYTFLRSKWDVITPIA